MEDVRLTVIVAAFNEQDAIGATLDDLHAHLPPGSEILVVDGGRDRTGEIVRERAQRIPGLRHIAHVGDRGKGHAIRTGMREARGRVQAQFDGDGQFFARDLAALIAPLERGESDLVLGSRFMRGSGADEQASSARTLGNFALSAWFSVLFARRFTDVLAGIKAWTRDAARTIEPRSDTYEYEVELPARALRADLRVIEVPVATRARAAGESKVRVVRVGAKIGWAMLRFRWAR